MRFYNVDMKGKFFVQRGTALPANDPSNEGRLFYNETNETMYLHDASAWQAVASTGSAAPYLRKDMDDVTTYDLTADQMYSSAGVFRSTTGTIVLTTSDALNYVRVIDGVSWEVAINGAQRMYMDSGGNLQIDGTLQVSGPSGQIAGSAIWTAGNDGPGSGLNADVLDNQQGTYYLDAGNLTGTVPVARLSGTYNISITGTARYA